MSKNNPPGTGSPEGEINHEGRVNQMTNMNAVSGFASSQFRETAENIIRSGAPEDETELKAGFSPLGPSENGYVYDPSNHPGSIRPDQLRRGLDELAPPLLRDALRFDGMLVVYTGKTRSPKYNSDGTMVQFSAETADQIPYTDPKTFPNGVHVDKNEQIEAEPSEVIFPAADRVGLYFDEVPDSFVEELTKKGNITTEEARVQILTYYLASAVNHELVHVLAGAMGPEDRKAIEGTEIGKGLLGCLEVAKATGRAVTPYSDTHAKTLSPEVGASEEEKDYAALEMVAEMVTLITVSSGDDKKRKDVKSLNPALYDAVYSTFFRASSETPAKLGSVATR